jgi:hypothetical protein
MIKSSKIYFKSLIAISIVTGLVIIFKMKLLDESDKRNQHVNDVQGEVQGKNFCYDKKKI